MYDGSLLHLAAEAGDVEACIALIASRADIDSRARDRGNNTSLTPLEVAREGSTAEHKRLQELLEGPFTAGKWRCVTGRAHTEAVTDNSPVYQVQWFSIPLRGAARQIGATHSLLKISVDDGREYTLEKVWVVDPMQETQKNGVLISYWQDLDVATLLHGHCFRNLVRPVSGLALSVADLRQVAIELGRYNVSTSNCHHAALAVHNHCAGLWGEQQVAINDLPNKNLASFAGMLQLVGVDVAERTSCFLRSGPALSQSSQSSGDASHSSVQEKLLQNSFASDDFMATTTCRDLVEHYVSGWKMCPLLKPVIDDDTWILHWARQLHDAKAVIVVFSNNYRSKCNLGSDLMKEAVEIINRRALDATSYVYIMDPQEPRDDMTCLKTFMETGVRDHHFGEWRDFLHGKGIAQMLQDALPSQQVNHALITVDADIEINTAFRNNHAHNTEPLQMEKGMRGRVVEVDVNTGAARINFFTGNEQWVDATNFCHLVARPARPSLPMGSVISMSQSISQLSMSLQTSWASGDEDYLQRYQEFALTRAANWHFLSSAEPAAWEQELQCADAVLLLFTENYRTCCTPGSQLMFQAKQILSRASRAGCRVAVLDPATSGQGPDSLWFLLLDSSDYPHLNIENLRSFVRDQKVMQQSDGLPYVVVQDQVGGQIKENLPNGTICQVLESAGDYTRIKINSNGVEGWVENTHLVGGLACTQALQHSNRLPSVDVHDKSNGQVFFQVPNGTICQVRQTSGDFTNVHIESINFGGWVTNSSLTNNMSGCAPHHEPVDCKHVFDEVTRSQPTWCSLCDSFLWGLTRQGQQCRVCRRIFCLSCSVILGDNPPLIAVAAQSALSPAPSRL